VHSLKSADKHPPNSEAAYTAVDLSHRFCVAPMMDWTDRHDRVFLRQLSEHTLLYTEMVTSAALKHGDAQYLLQHSQGEHPVALQLGGSNPVELAEAAVLAEQAGYDEINLNVGCPSNRVQSGAFGACLMAEPELVAKCVSNMMTSVSLPVTVKCRIGIDDRDSQAELEDFIGTVADAGCGTFIVHARKAILSGLSPKENREIPPLKYNSVFAVKQAFPELSIIINGGIKTLQDAEALLKKTDGVMLGREAYQNPFILNEVDAVFFGAATNAQTRTEGLQKFIPYIEEELERGTPLHNMTRHILGLYKGQKGGKKFRRHLSENSYKKAADIGVLLDAISYVD
jgi:tRNA-dihydrouridine synthase A